MKELILKKITLRKRWSLSIFLTCIIVMWAGLFMLLYFTSVDDNSYLNFPLVLILFICIVFSILGIYMIKFFNAYITNVNQLSEREALTFVEQGSSRAFAEQWLPSFIIYADKVQFFKIFSQPVFTFTDIKSIHFKRFNFTRSRQDCRISIHLLNGTKHNYHINGSLSQRNYLKNEATACNPKIRIDDQYA